MKAKFILMLALFMLVSNIAVAVTYDTAEQIITIKVNPENYIRISGAPVIEIKRRGPDGMVHSNGNKIDWTVDSKGVKKITAVLNKLYEGIELKIEITSGAGQKILSTDPVDVVTNLKSSIMAGQEIIYTAVADSSAPVGEQSRIVMFTLMDQ
jgi:hypothetical protein